MLEINTNILVVQLNRAAINLLNALVTRWIVQIRLFDFKIKHIVKKKHLIINRLLRRLYIKLNN